jgi:hypothetical protein
MAPKRPRDDEATRPAKKQKKKGFSVGPANLPEGIHKQKGRAQFRGLLTLQLASAG